MNAFETRPEYDFPGAMDIPAAACWGAHSARAVANFSIAGQTVAQMPELLRALAFVNVIQGGAGTSTNVNANEEITNARSNTWASPKASTSRSTERPRERVAEHKRRVPDRAAGGGLVRHRGLELLVFAIMIGEDELRLREARELITEVNLGAAAIGTGNKKKPAGYAEMVVPLLTAVLVA